MREDMERKAIFVLNRPSSSKPKRVLRGLPSAKKHQSVGRPSASSLLEAVAGGILGARVRAGLFMARKIDVGVPTEGRGDIQRGVVDVSKGGRL